MRVELPYGRTPYPIDVDGEVVIAPSLPPPPPLETLLDRALATTRFSGRRVTVVISDATRAEPRASFLDALRRHLNGVELTVAVATGTHGPADVPGLGLPAWVDRVVNHDGRSDLVELGTTTRGTPVRLHRCVVEADLVIATGCIRPHYFAGFGAGCKAIFPGLGDAIAIRINHRLKTEPGARAGVVEGNPCREDLEEAVALVPVPKLLVNGVCDADGQIQTVVAGELVAAFRAGVAVARPWFTVRTPSARTVVASDRLPVTASLYQAAKIAAAVAPVVEPGGRLIVVAECADGVEPLATVNEAIFRIGVLPRLAPGVELQLVSGLAPDVVAQTLVQFAAQVEPLAGRVVVAPRASQLICEVT